MSGDTHNPLPEFVGVGDSGSVEWPTLSDEERRRMIELDRQIEAALADAAVPRLLVKKP